MLSSQKINRISIALRDFEGALKYASKASEYEMSTVEYEALLFAAIVSYWRPFSPNELHENGSAISAIKLADFERFSELELKLHENCKLLRNKVLAHSEYAFNPTKLDEQTGTFIGRRLSVTSCNFQVSVLTTLLNKLIEQCHNYRANYARVSTK